jgi:hypothetical protein
MRPFLTLFATLFLSGPCFGQDDDIKKLLGQPIERNLEDFEKIRVYGNFKVTLKKSDKNFISILNKDTEKLGADFITELDKHGVLEIKIAKDKGGEGTDSMEVTLHYKKIVGVDARRGAWIKFDNEVKEDSLTLEVASGGHIIAQKVNCRSIFGATSKGGSIRLAGIAATAHYNVFAGGEIYAFKLDSEDIWAKIRTGGQISVTGKNILDCTIFSGGTLMYKGEPKTENLVKKIAGEFRKIRS